MIKDLLINRKSTFRFKNKRIRDEDMDDILQAAINAPRISTTPDVEFIIIEDDDIKKACAEKLIAPGIETASYIIVVIVNTSVVKSEFLEEGEKYGNIDGTFAALSISLAVQEKGLGSTLLFHNTESLRELLQVPENYAIHAVIPIGYPESNEGQIKLNPEPTSVIHINRFILK